jgi:hypothetical protein
LGKRLDQPRQRGRGKSGDTAWSEGPENQGSDDEGRDG